VRPEKIDVGGKREGLANSLSGEIDSIVFLGPLTEICVRLPGGERITAHRQNRRNEGGEALCLGQKATVTWAAESGFVLADG
jgi:ABC-type Fe3+/spermidine/putrescine transport system ATPase subunit